MTTDETIHTMLMDHKLDEMDELDYTTDSGQGAILRKMTENKLWRKFRSALMAKYILSKSPVYDIEGWLNIVPARRNKLIAEFLLSRKGRS